MRSLGVFGLNVLTAFAFTTNGPRLARLVDLMLFPGSMRFNPPVALILLAGAVLVVVRLRLPSVPAGAVPPMRLV